MSKSFSIKSNRSDRAVIFRDYDGEDFRVVLEGVVTASIEVFGYAPHGPDLAAWFKELGNQHVPWIDELSWVSLEGEFEIKARSSSLGQIYIGVALADARGTSEEIHIRAGLETELGQLPEIASKAALFF